MSLLLLFRPATDAPAPPSGNVADETALRSAHLNAGTEAKIIRLTRAGKHVLVTNRHATAIVYFTVAGNLNGPSSIVEAEAAADDTYPCGPMQQIRVPSAGGVECIVSIISTDADTPISVTTFDLLPDHHGRYPDVTPARRAAATGPVLSDTFTRADSAVSLGNADTGQAYTALAGTWGISSNQAYLAVSNAPSIAVVDAGISDIDMTIDVTVASGQPSVVFRGVDIPNHLAVFFEADNELSMYSVVANSYTLLDTAAAAFSGDGTYEVRILAVGTAIEVFLDGLSVMTATSSQFQTATLVGFRLEDSSACRWDNLTVTAP
jgi:hypothetical protein